ncbi:MAG TPA: putative phage abortive infection protein [Bacteroidia bacterium]|nr:putative phage abortive infection protein [Bacteroidia bacterium]
MITLCCYEHICKSQINWSEIFTALGTVALAFITLFLAKNAIKQLEDIKRSSMENNIMKQIDFHYKILERIEANKKDAFRIMFENLIALYGFEKDKPPTTEEQINFAFSKLYEEYGYLFGHYYRNLYRIFKNIKETKIEGFEKKYYAKLVRAQLSEYEILLLFYNCIWIGSQDEEKFKNLVEEYELLEGINYEKLLDREHYKLYLKKAFGVDVF